jgi:hypothetical protein
VIALDEGDELVARPAIETAVRDLELAGKRLGDAFLSGAIRKAAHLLRRQDGRLAQAEAWAAQAQSERDVLERQRDELRRAERALRARLTGDKDAPLILVPPRLENASTEPLLARIRERDAARAELAAARAEIDVLRRAAAEEIRLESPPAILSPIGDTPAGDPTAEDVLEARRSQLVAEADEINRRFAAAPPGSRRSREYRQWHAGAVKRTQAIQAELRDVNAQLKVARIARQQATLEEALRRKGKAKKS